MQTPALSFVIPSVRERRADLTRCLSALTREPVGVAAEVLVVVEDEAAAAGLAQLGNAELTIRPILQPGGAARRRNAAFREVRGGAIVLLDDDAEPLPGYCAALLMELTGRGDRIVQGAVWPDFEVEPPAELEPVIFSLGGFNRHGGKRRTDVFISANCAFTRPVLDRVGPMREDLGPGSGGVPWGDDTEWQERARSLGVVTEFADTMAVRHRIQAERISVEAVLARAESVGRTRARLEWAGKTPGLAVLLRQRALSMWAASRCRDLPARCVARRLGGYADELSKIRAGG